MNGEKWGRGVWKLRGGGGGGGEGDYIYPSLHCHYQNDFCIKMGSDESDESHFNQFHNCEGQRHKTVSTDHNLSSERRTEAILNRGPSAYQLTALPPGQTSSQG